MCAKGTRSLTWLDDRAGYLLCALALGVPKGHTKVQIAPLIEFYTSLQVSQIIHRKNMYQAAIFFPIQNALLSYNSPMKKFFESKMFIKSKPIRCPSCRLPSSLDRCLYINIIHKLRLFSLQNEQILEQVYTSTFKINKV